VSAEHGSDSKDATSTPAVAPTTTDTPTTSKAETHREQTTTAKPKVETETQTTTEAESTSGDRKTTLRAEASQLLQDRRKDIKEHTEAERQKACTERQGLISARAAHFGIAAQDHLDTFNKIFARLQAYQTSKQLDVSNYDALVAVASSKQAAAQTAVDALKALDTAIDCTQADPAGAVATIKTAAADARAALQAYRAAIKDLTTALKTAADAQKATNTTGGTQ